MVVSTDVYTVAATNIRTADGHVIHFSVGSLLNYEMELGRVHEDQIVDRPVVGVHKTNEPRAASIRSMTSVRERKKRDIPCVTALVSVTLDAAGRVCAVHLEIVCVLDQDHVSSGSCCKGLV